MREQNELEISADELRIKVRSLAMLSSGMIEEAVDALETSTIDVEMCAVGLR